MVVMLHHNRDETPMRIVNVVQPPFLRPRVSLRPAILAFGLACIFSHSVTAGVNRWTVTGPPLEVRAMAVDPHDNRILYAGGFESVARSDDAGASWTLTPVPGLTQPSTMRVAFSLSSTVYALGVSELYRSVSAGTTWARRSTPTAAQFPMDLQVDARNADVIVIAASNFCFFGCSGGGVYRSTNGGGSWHAAGLKDMNVSHVALDPTSSAVMYATSGSTLMRTGNSGSSWSSISLPASGEIFGVAVDPVVPSIVYAAAMAGVFRSMDSGQSWELLRSSAYGALLDVAAGDSRWLFTSATGTALSTDGGNSWLDLSTSGSGFLFNSLWQVVVTRDACYMVSDLVGRPGQILAYQLRQVHRRAVPGR